ncbi:hypothetical protein F5887DRAFT_1080596 [Amanita rubescens]|nr:hypothetical protein F5887DRAFT_1080596 [Amanita rubescens]
MVFTDVGSLLLVIEQGMKKVLAETSQTYQPVQPHLDPVLTEVYNASDLDFFRSPLSPHSRIEPLPRSTHEATGNRTLPLTSEVLEYLEGDIPEPPVEIGLDVYQLSTVWNDSWPTWKSVSPLIIKSRPVPLMHLRCVYGGTGHWKHLKQQWSKCNFLMTEYESLGPENFWKKWTVQGHKSPPSKILDSLAKDRKEKEREDARAAKEAYVTNFQELFSYKKGGKTYRMVSDKAIARRF